MASVGNSSCGHACGSASSELVLMVLAAVLVWGLVAHRNPVAAVGLGLLPFALTLLSAASLPLSSSSTTGVLVLFRAGLPCCELSGSGRYDSWGLTWLRRPQEDSITCSQCGPTDRNFPKRRPSSKATPLGSTQCTSFCFHKPGSPGSSGRYSTHQPEGAKMWPTSGTRS